MLATRRDKVLLRHARRLGVLCTLVYLVYQRERLKRVTWFTTILTYGYKATGMQ